MRGSIPITVEDITEAKEVITAHGLPFDEAGWTHILNKHNGFLPIRIKAVPEGLVLPTNLPMVTVESTDPKVPWVVSWVETLLLKIWYPVTVATQSWHCKQIIRGYLNTTSDDPESEIPFKLHDFGYRGVSSEESALIGGMSHLVNLLRINKL